MPSRHAAHRAYEAARTIDERRAMALSDLFYLMVVILSRVDMDNDWCFARCREVQNSPNGHLDLWAREHYKSTIITVGKTIQDILENPEITVGIFSHSRPMAKSFLNQIKRTFESCQELKDLFPDVLWSEPKRQSPKWSEDGGLIVRRAANPKEATVEAWGLVDGQPIGKHFSLLIYDDVVTMESVFTPDQIKKTTEAWRLSLNLGAHGGTRRIIGTRYHAADTYSVILRQGSAAPRLYPATKDGTFDGEPVFLPRQVLSEKRRDMGSNVFACQMLQNPRADAASGFRAEWFATYGRDLMGGNRPRKPGHEPGRSFGGASGYGEHEADHAGYSSDQQAVGRTSRPDMASGPSSNMSSGMSAHRPHGMSPGAMPWQRMNRYIIVDPASEKKRGSDYTVMWVVGLSDDRNYYVIDGVRDRLSLTERAAALFRLHRAYAPLAVGYEKYGQQADIEHIQSRMDSEAYHFAITQLGGQMPKNDRIRRLVPLFENRRILFPYRLIYMDYEGATHDLTRDFLEDEFLMFPVSGHDDMLDALARIVDPELGAAFPRTAEALRIGLDAPRKARTEYDVTSYGMSGM